MGQSATANGKGKVLIRGTGTEDLAVRKHRMLLQDLTGNKWTLNP